MACSVRDSGVESIFSRGFDCGDWHQRQHPSDLLLACVTPPLPHVEHDMGGAAAVDADQGDTAPERDAQLRHTAACIAAVTARVLMVKGVDDATIADAVGFHKPRVIVLRMFSRARCRCTAAVQATKSCCCT